MAKSYLNRTDLPRGIRNNNPANLIKTGIAWKGEVTTNTDGHFEQFKELKYGIRALYRQLYTDIEERNMNLRQLINKFAPSFENNTNAYIEFVSKKSRHNHCWMGLTMALAALAPDMATAGTPMPGNI